MARTISLIKVETVLLLSCVLLISSAAGAAIGHIPHERLSRSLLEASGKSPEAADGESIEAIDGESIEAADSESIEAADSKRRKAAKGKSREAAPGKSPEAAPVKSRKAAAGGGREIFDVTDYGAIPNNEQRDSAQAFIKTWVAACKSASPAKMVIPSGKFLVGPVVFQGPCKSSEPIIVQVIGDVIASSDISDFPEPQWITFENVRGLVVTGTGTFDGQGPKVWKYNDCKSNSDCAKLPASLRFSDVKNAIIEGITSLNSKWFHVFIYRCNNLTIDHMKVIAPDESPNTDGIHISSSTSITVTGTDIGTGDDCVGIVQDSHDILVENVNCGPGHGISIGSLGKWPTDKGVSNIHVKNCTLTKSTNGARIKTWGNSNSGTATGIIFQDIVMHDVKNPIIIDQSYGSNKKPSHWEIKDIQFNNIKGTSTSKVAVSLGCSQLFPCQGVKLTDINLAFSGPNLKTTQTDSICSNAKITLFDSQNPPACSSKGAKPTDSYVAAEEV